MNADARREFPKNFVEHLCSLAALRPHDIGLVVVREAHGETVEEAISYALLDRRIRAVAAELQGFERGSRVLLLLDNDDQYVVAFFACLYAGLIAVPVFPPESLRPQHLARLIGIGQDASASCILTTRALHQAFGAAMLDSFDAVTIAVDAVDLTRADDCTPCAPKDNDIALLQYTSGSTSAPKGVMVSHGNLIANARVIEEGFRVGADDVFVSWLPLFHDMGLVGGLLQPIHRGIKAVLLTPRFFIERPVRWLEAISRHRGTISGGPNFAFRLCLERITDAQLERLDLSSWRVAFCGAEPIQSDVLCKMSERFARAGLSPTAASPCYGLAEATLYVTGAERGVGMIARAFSGEALARGDAELADDGRTLVSCGHSVSSHPFEIVDPVTQAPLSPGRLGEIWTTGPSVALGYWNKPEATRESFVERGGRTWLRTGDLGFVHDGQLYVAGRVKDLIIVRGQNLYPQDLEQAVELEVEAVRKGRVAAFSVASESGEGIGVAAEVSRGMQKLVSPAALVDAIGVAVSESCGEAPSVVVLLNPSGLPKTSSGKLQRSACRVGWSEGSLNAYAVYERGRFVLGGTEATSGIAIDTEPQDDIESTLAALWRLTIGLAEDVKLGADAHFLNSGGNSLQATQLAARIALHWGLQLGLREIFEHPRLGRLAAEVRRRLAAGQRQTRPRIPMLAADQRTAPLPLSRAQERQWFLHQLDPGGSAYHVGLALRVSGRLLSSELRGAFEELCTRHESLRTVFRAREDGVPEQLVLPAVDIVLNELELSGHGSNERDALAAEAAQHTLVVPFDLAHGPLLRVSLLRLADESSVLVVVAHHIISDGWSMQLLMDEWATLYRARAQQQSVALPPLPIQYLDYAVWQREWHASTENERQLSYWKKQLGTAHPVLQISTDRPRRADGRYVASLHELELDPELAKAISACASERGVTRFMILLAGVQVLLHRHSGQRDIRIGVPVANRQRVETTGVVGFFVNTQVIRAELDGRQTLSSVLQQTKEAALAAQAHQDAPFEQLVEMLQPTRTLGQNPLFQVLFNQLREDYRALAGLPGLSVERYRLGEQDAQFELAFETCEQSDGSIRCSIRYAKELFEPSTIARLSRHLQVILRNLCHRPELRIADIDVMDRDERAQLERWSVNPRQFLASELIPRVIERQARERPDATALIFEQSELSYGELNRRANQLAHRLLHLGVKPEAKVGVLAERSLEMVVGLLATLKAGAAYVPLDPEYPPERLAFMMQDSGIELLLSQSHLRQHRSNDSALRTLELDGLDLSQELATDPSLELHGEHLAYVIYTSGSTGKP
ncbi:MAG: AMP-binding protein, partial [Polyangiaceae bacterium]